MTLPLFSRLPCAAALLLVLLSANAQAAMPASVNGEGLPSLAPLVEQTAPAVVNIRTRSTVSAPRNPLMEDPFFRRFFGVPEGQQQPDVGLGSQQSPQS